MKYIKKIAFGTMTSALCLFGFASKADRVDLNVAVGGRLLLDGNEIFGEKSGKKEESTTEGTEDKDKNKDTKLGIFDTWGFAIRGEAGYVYDFNEYVGVGVVAGVGFGTNSAAEVKGEKNDSNEDSKGTASAKFIDAFGGLRLMVYPLGDHDFLLGLDVVGKFAFKGMFSNDAFKDFKKEKGEHRSSDAISDETSKAMNSFGVGGNLFVGYDFRNLMDFPLTLGLDVGLTYLVNGMFDTTEQKDTTEADAKDKKEEKYAFGNKLGVKDKTTSSPSMVLNVGVKMGVDVGYYIFGA